MRARTVKTSNCSQIATHPKRRRVFISAIKFQKEAELKEDHVSCDQSLPRIFSSHTAHQARYPTWN